MDIDNKLIKEFESTDEFKEWKETLFAIIGYTTNSQEEDEELASSLIADHLDASLQLQNGIDKIKFKAQYEKTREFNKDFESDLRGE